MLSPEFARQSQGKSSWDVIKALYATAGSGDFLQRMTYIELKHRLAELLLMRVDKMSMANSIEARGTVCWITNWSNSRCRYPPPGKSATAPANTFSVLRCNRLSPRRFSSAPNRAFAVRPTTCFSHASWTSSLPMSALVNFWANCYTPKPSNISLHLSIAPPTASNFGTSGILPSGTSIGFSERDPKNLRYLGPVQFARKILRLYLSVPPSASCFDRPHYRLRIPSTCS